MSATHKIIRVLNNNVLLTQNLKNQTEEVLVGKGIGFGHKNGKDVTFTPEQIDKSFVLFDGKYKKDYLELVEQMDNDIMALCAEIISMAEQRLGTLSSRIHIVLTDHIGFAIERIKAGMEILNPFLHEIKSLYEQEYQVGLQAKQMILERTGVEIVDDEVGFIALHLSAARQGKDVKESMRNTRLVKELIAIIESNLEYKISSDLTYNRLIHHLRGALDRIEKQKHITNPLLGTFKNEFKFSYRIAELMKAHIEKELGVHVPEDELGYMAIHINRIKRIAESEYLS